MRVSTLAKVNPKMFVVIILTCFALAFANEEYNFKCKPKQGCDFSHCDPIPFYFRSFEGFDSNEYRKRYDYHIICQPKFDVKAIGNQQPSVEGYVTEEKMKQTIADLETSFEEKISKKNKDHDLAILKLELRLKNTEMEMKNEKARLDKKFSFLNAQLTKILQLVTQLAPVGSIEATTLAPTPPPTPPPTSPPHNNCEKFPGGFEYLGKCFWLMIKYSYHGTRSYSVTKGWCKDTKGYVGNVYSGDHYKIIEERARKQIEGSNIFFWTAMTYDLTTKIVYLGNSIQAPYVKWYSTGYPTSIQGHTGIKIQFNSSPHNHGYYNRPHYEDSKGVLCECAI